MPGTGRGPLRIPSWLVGPGFVLSPFFLAMFAAVAARPVAPTVAMPRLDRDEADRQVASLLARRGQELDESEDTLLRTWETYGRLQLLHERTGEQTEAVAAADANLGRGCKAVVDDRGVERVLAVGDVAAGRLVAALLSLSTGDEAGERRAEATAGTFLSRARQVGLVDPRGRLRGHPLVAAVAVKAGFRAECGLPAETGFLPVELAAMDVLTMRFAPAAPPTIRAAAAARLGQYDSTYPAARARAAILLAGDQPAAALDLLEEAASQAPWDWSLRNNLLYVVRELGRGR